MTRYNCLQFIRPGQADENTMRLNQFELKSKNMKIRVEKTSAKLVTESVLLSHLPERTNVMSRQMTLPMVTTSMTQNQNHRMT